MDYLSAKDLAALLSAKQVSAVELTDRAIARIEAHDGKLNAVVVRDFERARAAAIEADKALARGEKRPLLGLPMTVKECADVAGLPTTWGIPGTERIPVTEDAVAVTRLKAAGAIVLGKTNVPLMLADMQSYNAIYGTTNNPWDLSRTPGGSSGGAAAALAAGFVPLELGTDIGGSLRIPAHFCGVFAHKPTHGIVPQRGIAPPGTPQLSIPIQVPFAVAGPMARSAGDLALALDVLAGPDAADALGYKLELPPPRHADLREFRVLVIDQHPLLPVAANIRAALDAMADRLAKHGVTVARTSPLLPDLARVGRTFIQMLSAIFAADAPDEVYARLQSKAAALPPEATSVSATRLRGNVMSFRDWVRADRMRIGITDRWQRLFREWDVVLCPVMPTAAFAHDHGEMAERRMSVDGTDIAYGDQIMWSANATLAGLPSTAMPIALSSEGLPIGMQIIGPAMEDRTTIAFAELVEREYGGFVAPPAFKS
ncbi:MAG TPA: amidase [Bradyrhizobium sp.]|nr:amidase [Bradyrhizobium sp.]HWX57285.1 amidase [Bradyrhizobium sp.]